MSKERELLVRIYRFLESDVENDFGLGSDIRELLTHPEPIKEREVSGKIISTDDSCNWNLTVGGLKDYDHVYVNGIRYTEYQPDINTQAQPEQEPVAWMNEGVDETGETVRSIYQHFYEHANLIPLYASPPKREPLTPRQGLEEYKRGYARAELDLKREPLSDDEMRAIWKEGIRGEIPFVEIGRAIEKAHGITGVDDE